MSGTDYTTTPSLGLYMPVYDMDDGNWGTHLNYNAQTLDSAIGALQGTTAGGPFLPLGGGTATGAITISSGGLHFGSQTSGAYNDFTKHIDLYGGAAGINIGSGNVVNYVSPGGGAHAFFVAGSGIGYLNAGGMVLEQGGFFCTGVSGASPTDTSNGLTFYNGGAGNVYGISLTSGRVNYVTGGAAAHVFIAGTADRLTITGSGMGFNGAAAVAKPTVTGAKGSNAALASLMTALAAYGLVTDSTT